MNDEDIIAKYVEIRDFLKKRAEARAEEDKPYNESLTAMEGYFLDKMNKNGDQSIKTNAGTAYKSTTMSAKVDDPSVFFDFIRESDAFELLTTNVSKDAVKTYMEEHQGTPPPGVSTSTFTKVNFRRA